MEKTRVYKVFVWDLKTKLHKKKHMRAGDFTATSLDLLCLISLYYEKQYYVQSVWYSRNVAFKIILKDLITKFNFREFGFFYLFLHNFTVLRVQKPVILKKKNILQPQLRKSDFIRMCKSLSYYFLNTCRNMVGSLIEKLLIC